MTVNIIYVICIYYQTVWERTYCNYSGPPYCAKVKYTTEVFNFRWSWQKSEMNTIFNSFNHLKTRTPMIMINLILATE